MVRGKRPFLKSIILCAVFIYSIRLFGQTSNIRLGLPLGHVWLLKSGVFSNDNKHIVTMSGDKTIKIWDANKGHLLQNLKQERWGFTKVILSPDGKKALTIDETSVVKIWDVESGKILKELIGHKDRIRDINISNDGENAITASEDETAKIWNIENGSLVRSLEGHPFWVEAAQYNSEVKKAITLSSGRVFIWDIENRTCFHISLDDSILFEKAILSSDGRFLLTSGRSRVGMSDSFICQLWDAASRTLLFNVAEHSKEVVNVDFSLDGKLCFSASKDGIAIVWDIENKKQMIKVEGLGELTTATLSPDCNFIATGDRSGSVSIRDINNGKLMRGLNCDNFVTSMQFNSLSNKILTCFGYQAAIWDIKSGNLIVELTSHATKVSSVGVDSAFKFVAIAAGNGTVQVWKINQGRVEGILDYKSIEFTGIKNFRDGQMFVTCSDSNLYLWDVNTGNKLIIYRGYTYGINSVSISPNGKFMAIFSDDGTVGIWDVKNGKYLHTLYGHSRFISYSTFNQSGQLLATASWDNTVKIWDVEKGNMLLNLRDVDHNDIEFVAFSPNGEDIITTSFYIARIWSLKTGKVIDSLIGPSVRVRNATFSSDGSSLVLSWGSLARIWKIKNERQVIDLKGHSDDVLSSTYSTDKQLVITISEDGSFIIWDARTGQKIVQQFVFDGSEPLSLLATGYYMCSKKAASALYYVKGMQTIGFDQLDVKYNRPDKVLSALGNAFGHPDTALINSYYKAWQKRIKKLGIDTTHFRDGYSVPEADFVNRDGIEYEQTNGKLKLHIKGMDSTYALDRCNVWVNEMPVYGQKGIRMGQRDFIDTTLTIELSEGENRIETSVLNVNGTESYRMPLYVKYTPQKKAKQKVHFIGIGMDRFANEQYNLNYSSKDIRDLASGLKKRYGDTLQTDTLFNENVTADNIKKLKQKLLQTGINDKVIIAYSGHGLLSKDYDYYLSTYTVDFEHPEKNGLPYEALENLLDSIPARQRLMLIDACHSGEVDKEEAIYMSRIADSLGLSKGAAVSTGADSLAPHLGLQNSFELMQNLFVNVGKGTGATVISASAGTQFALERGDLKNGVFTYSILEALKQNPGMSVSQLKNKVGQRVTELTGGLQKPNSRGETLYHDWRVW
ncbi:MAG: caspase family protein [Bacteroidetes bacterium]|nr:caspase family protein [Bacteroidota bacterium]